MTVANQTARTSATGTATAGQEIAYSFPAGATSELEVRTRITATGVQTDPLTETTDYTATFSDTGGTVTMVNAIPATQTIHVERKTPKTQALDLVAGGSFDAESVEEALDKGIRVGADNADGLSRCMQLPETDAAADMTLPSSVDREGYLFFVAGLPTVTDAITDSTAPVSAYGKTLVAAVSAAAARGVLEVVIGTDVQAYDAQLADIAALAVTNGNFIVGDGTNWVAESGATALTSLGAVADADVTKKDASVAYTSTGVGFRDEDDMLSNDATAPPSQQSVAAFLYSQVSYDGDVLTYDGDVVTYV